ncbi:hypothetical protein [Paracoccus sp. SM22M-07]|uniref:hypothetical protein n=1 Tax=Paracoccus sp. SM22M-07 TaxID=1520813 RepID=UPI000ACC2DE7|nr:hypothetical protein [Paracoccus sp. SM22M-07]
MQAPEQKRKDVADLRHVWIARRQPIMASHLERLAFIHETSVKMNMAKTTAWAPCGRRLVDHAGSGIGRPRPSLPRCAMTGWTRTGSSTAR